MNTGKDPKVEETLADTCAITAINVEKFAWETCMCKTELSNHHNETTLHSNCTGKTFSQPPLTVDSPPSASYSLPLALCFLSEAFR